MNRTIWSASLALVLALSPMGQETVDPAPPPARSQDFHFVNMGIRSAFKALSDVGSVDIVVAPNVAGQNVNLELTDKTWQEALSILTQMYNLKYSIGDNYLYVQTLADYNKNRLESATADQQAGAVAALQREIVPIKNAKAQDLAAAVRDLLSTRGKLNVVERNNALIILDTKANIREIKMSILKLDVPTVQVNISAKLIQVNSDALKELGIDWQLATRGDVTALLNNPGKLPTTPQNRGVITASPAGTGGTGTGTATGTAGSQTAVAGVAGATSQMAFGLLNGNLAIAVAHLLSTSQGEVLAQPQITTLDNMEAEIFLGEQVPQRILDQMGVPSIINQEAGTALKVTPHVTGDGKVLMELAPEKSSFRPNPSGGQFIIERQNAKTTVLVSNGETVVIAGLTSKEENEVETGIPFLKDIPILGYLFKKTRTEVRKRDLIIFVTPHIVDTEEGKQARNSAEALQISDEEMSPATYAPASSPSAATPPAQNNAPGQEQRDIRPPGAYENEW